MVDLMETTVTWTVKQFDMCPQLAGQCIESPNFRVGPYEFCVDLYPRGKEGEFDKYVSLYLRRLEDYGATEVSILNGMCVDDAKGLCTEVCKQKSKSIFKKNENFGRRKLFERQLLLSTKKLELLRNNNLTIKCKISLLPVEDIKTDDGKLYSEEASERLSRDFDELLKTGIHFDMTIVVSDSKFNVHRAVLECRCPRLMSELKVTKVQNQYHLPNFKTSVLQILLQYLYAGTCNVSNMYKSISHISNCYCLPDFINVFPYPRHISASTEIDVYRLSFTWNISDLKTLQPDQEVVYPVSYYLYEWYQLEIILTTTKSENGSDELQLKFRKMCPADQLFIRCQISFSTVNVSDTVVIREWEHIFDNETWIPPLDLRSHPLGLILCENTLNLSFELSIAEMEAIYKIDSLSIDPKAQKVCVETIKNLKLLQQDYHTLHSNPKFSDVTLCVGDSKLPAHKAILCARSPVFAKMFEHDTLEKKDGVITIEDIDSSTVSSMLQYMYCGCIDAVELSETIRIYSAADKYDLIALKDMCGTFLKSLIHAEHVGEILLLADAHHDESLKRCVYEYITSNPEEVLRSENGLSILNDRLDVYPNLFKVLLEHMASLKEGKSASSN